MKIDSNNATISKRSALSHHLRRFRMVGRTERISAQFLLVCGSLAESFRHKSAVIKCTKDQIVTRIRRKAESFEQRLGQMAGHLAPSFRRKEASAVHIGREGAGQ